MDPGHPSWVGLKPVQFWVGHRVARFGYTNLGRNGLVTHSGLVSKKRGIIRPRAFCPSFSKTHGRRGARATPSHCLRRRRPPPFRRACQRSEAIDAFTSAPLSHSRLVTAHQGSKCLSRRSLSQPLAVVTRSVDHSGEPKALLASPSLPLSLPRTGFDHPKPQTPPNPL
ncbi:hypothetical protein V6N11_073074 [Hibiscus sabdariffa]|uniref:Uncharacterized protein n=2 Tax=Hibiscus sabdariffa TaxID=183260 RepID=A0ABR2NX38_9ROSI